MSEPTFVDRPAFRVLGIGERIDPMAADYMAFLVAREVPAACYAVFSCAINAIGPTWKAIFGEWMPGSGQAFDEGKPPFEFFPPGSDKGEAPVRIFLPVRTAP